MHLCTNRLSEQLTDIEQAHVERCQECTQQREMLLALKASVDQMELVTPPQDNWLEISRRLDENRNESMQAKPHWSVSIAASVICVCVGWLIWNNHNLQRQLDTVLQINNGLELQLVQENVPVLQRVSLMDDIRRIDMTIRYTQDQQEKKQLLEQRQQLIKALQTPQGDNNEISI